jgi:LPXTG-motif cell wall-anchored protein
MAKKSIFILIVVVVLGYGGRIVSAQTSASVLYVPLIGITSVPSPLVLPKGPGDVTYHYAVKDFLEGVPLANIQVSDDKCSHVTFVTGDDNGNRELDYGETWRYVCTTKVSTTTQSIATATGMANNITATHSVYATVVVGSNNPAPLVSIINITKVAYPVSLPAGGGPITFTYKVNNPGVAPLSDVALSDNKCSNMSGHLGDTNGNGLLDINEVWIYTCTTTLTTTTANTVTVTGFANGLMATDSDTITVNVATSSPGFPAQEIPGLPNTGSNPNMNVAAWAILAAILAVLGVAFLVIRKKKETKM